MSCEKALAKLPRNLRAYICSQYVQFPGLPLRDYVRGIAILLRHGYLPNESDFKAMAEVYKRNPWGKDTWKTIIKQLQFETKSTPSVDAKVLFNALKESVKRSKLWWS